jgi:hypothetical protein
MELRRLEDLKYDVLGGKFRERAPILTSRDASLKV